MKFKTNIKCANCLATVTPHLNKAAGENNWEVNLVDPDRILTVETDKTQSEILDAVKAAGFVAEKI